MAQKRLRHGHAGLGRALRTPDPVHLTRRLDPAPQLDRRVVDGQRDPVGPQPLGDAEREVEVDDRRPNAGLGGGPRHQLGPHLIAFQPAAQKLVEPEVGDVQKLGVGPRHADPLALEAGGHNVGLPANLRVQERVGDRDRDLVAHRRAVLGVAVQENIAHALDPNIHAVNRGAP